MLKRFELFDFLRGYFVIHMIAAHTSITLNSYYDYSLINKTLMYIESGIEGFLFLAGIMISLSYLPKFEQNSTKCTFNIFKRVIQIVFLQYVLLVTVSFPEHYFLLNKNDYREFVFRSLLFLNQVGPFHILPTFIPVFLMIPIILYLFNKKLDHVVIIGSLLLFFLGLYKPYLINIGDKAIFPFILYQLYFVLGCCWGKVIRDSGKIIPNAINKIFFLSFLFIVVMFSAKHGHHIVPYLLNIRMKYGINFSKFPYLTFSGFLYQMSLMVFAFAITMKYWKKIYENRVVTPIFCLLGRNALAVFVMHIYADAIIRTITRYYLSELFTWISIITTSGLIVLAVYFREKGRKKLAVSIAMEA